MVLLPYLLDFEVKRAERRVRQQGADLADPGAALSQLFSFIGAEVLDEGRAHGLELHLLEDLLDGALDATELPEPELGGLARGATGCEAFGIPEHGAHALQLVFEAAELVLVDTGARLGGGAEGREGGLGEPLGGEEGLEGGLEVGDEDALLLAGIAPPGTTSEGRGGAAEASMSARWRRNVGSP